MLDTRTGRVVRTVPLGQVPFHPSALALDRRTRHVFVAAIGGATPAGIPISSMVSMLSAGP